MWHLRIFGRLCTIPHLALRSEILIIVPWHLFLSPFFIHLDLLVSYFLYCFYSSLFSAFALTPCTLRTARKNRLETCAAVTDCRINNGAPHCFMIYAPGALLAVLQHSSSLARHEDRLEGSPGGQLQFYVCHLTYHMLHVLYTSVCVCVYVRTQAYTCFY
jgi:hypothetical protein